MLIFFDIDGTLIGGDSTIIPESAREAIQEARQRGHICMINTGRSLKLVGEELTGQTEFDGLILGCGTMIVYHGETLLHRSFSTEESRRIIEGLRRFEIDACLEGSRDNFCEPYDRMFTDVFREFIHHFDHLRYRYMDEAPGQFDKLYAYVDRKEKMEGFQREFEDLLDFVDRRAGYYEIMPKGYSKASAMKWIAERLSIPMSQTAAIGDSSNDLPMLACAGISIAMGNATEDVKETADFVTTSVENDGIRNALRWLGALGER
ncbi:MAG: Cof-type HAD-IIB family hydrolase [Roseburia sp.]|nr:Cof-type HAD-IIB family hydrolase [Roseburia sp.]MCM1099417.1 Cof-type HAD-IIB family hydrolase [Ruminococcus flavefaciens]